jgi:transposase
VTPSELPCPVPDPASTVNGDQPIIAALLAQIELLVSERQGLLARIAELERRLGLNSSNSGKPPSSDGLKKPPRVSSLREPSGKKTGGQKGHPGETLRQVAKPDATIDHYPPACAGCGKPLTAATATGHVARQVFDLPEPKPLIVTEHRAHTCRCAACGTQTRGAFPEGATAPVQYGSRIAAFVLYLLHYQLLPEKRLTVLMADLFGVKLVTASIARISQDCAGASGISPKRYATTWQRRRSSTWMRPAFGSVAKPSGCTSPRPSGSPSTAPRPSAAACWPTSPALSCMTTGSPTTR